MDAAGTSSTSWWRRGWASVPADAGWSGSVASSGQPSYTKRLMLHVVRAQDSAERTNTAATAPAIQHRALAPQYKQVLRDPAGHFCNLEGNTDSILGLHDIRFRSTEKVWFWVWKTTGFTRAKEFDSNTFGFYPTTTIQFWAWKTLDFTRAKQFRKKRMTPRDRRVGFPPNTML